jgi:hypothetical protein
MVFFRSVIIHRKTDRIHSKNNVKKIVIGDIKNSAHIFLCNSLRYITFET